MICENCQALWEEESHTQNHSTTGWFHCNTCGKEWHQYMSNEIRCPAKGCTDFKEIERPTRKELLEEGAKDFANRFEGVMKELAEEDHSTMEGDIEVTDLTLELVNHIDWEAQKYDGEWLRQAVHLLLAKERESAERRGQMNPKVGFLRQYLNECGAFEKLWTDEDILGFIRLAFDEPKNYPEARKDTDV